MKRSKQATVAFIAVLMLTGCLYSNVKAPFDTDLDKTVLGPREGKASSYSVLWLFSWGDAGTAAAAKNGGIETINHMDVEVFSILFGLYSRTSTIVYGD